MAYALTQRTREIGIRMAVGAQPREVLADLPRQGMVPTMAARVAGMVAAFTVTRLVAGMLVNVGAVDPQTFTGAALLPALIVLAASCSPAR